ncbi:MAG: bifunctional folylpolyglutamate synthase/dihydrofolate synthase [Parasporobacterium sp.]|nr:bifunctional folylpolyglutamate synthase/dihydrofolate synthase [Parasporobacterium sp.]
MNYSEALNYISSVNWKGSVPGLERITELMDLLGNPQDSLKFVHIGGTNGKGSASAFISNVLRKAGYKTGLFISPYIVRFNERMQIDNQCISDEELAEITEYIRPFADSMKDSPTEFELNTAIAFVYFSRNNCDIVVLEVGMGGELDATNIIKAPEVVLITAIGLDHTEYLGDSLYKIASTKAGIIKKGSGVVLYRQGEEITEVIREKCREKGCNLYISEPDRLELLHCDIDGQTFRSQDHGNISIRLAAAYQKNNLAAAIKVIEVIRTKGYIISEEDLREGLAETLWPGRFEILCRKPVFLVDGAHNPHGMKAAADSLKAVFKDRKLILIFGVLKDKAYNEMLELILPLAGSVLCVTPDNSRALKAVELADIINSRGVPAEAYDSVGEAIETAFETAEEDDIICAVGSLYMIGDIKQFINTLN